MSVIPTVWVTEAFGLGRGSWSCGCWAKAPVASSRPAAERVASLFMCSSFYGKRNLSGSVAAVGPDGRGLAGLGAARRGLRIAPRGLGVSAGPALEVAEHQVGEEAHVVGAIVESRDVAVALAAGVEEAFAVQAVDLFQGLQAVGGEAGADHVEAADAGFRHGLD